MATIYKTHGEVIEVTPKNGKDFSLSEMQAIVGGYIEVLDLRNGKFLVINEEGKLIGLGINWEATKIYHAAYPCYDVIVGDALVCDKSQIK